MHYLEAMGIDMFVPRLLLPNSPPPRLCELPEAPLPESARRSAAPDRPLPAAALGVQQIVGAEDEAPPPVAAGKVAHSILNQLQTPSAQKKHTEPPVPPEAAASTAANVSFTLKCWQISTRLMVIDSHEPGAALPTAKLLQNMLAAAALLEVDLPGASTLVWPFPGADAMDRGWDAARQMICSFLAARYEQRPFSHLLLMGEAAQRGLEGWSESQEFPVGVEPASMVLHLLPSLADILREPASKAGVWSTLLAVKEGRSSTNC